MSNEVEHSLVFGYSDFFCLLPILVFKNLISVVGDGHFAVSSFLYPNGGTVRTASLLFMGSTNNINKRDFDHLR